MGYRSDVAIAITEEDYSNLVKEITFLVDRNKLEDKKDSDIQSAYELITRPDNLIGRVSLNARTCEKVNMVVLMYNNIKWYDGIFKDIDYIMDYVRKLDNYHYIRIGEDNNDIEDDFNGCIDPVIEVRRTIEFTDN